MTTEKIPVNDEKRIELIDRVSLLKILDVLHNPFDCDSGNDPENDHTFEAMGYDYAIADVAKIIRAMTEIEK